MYKRWWTRQRDFNPRPLAGATYFDKDKIRKALISIHAPLRGRLELVLYHSFHQRISIHAPLRGRLLVLCGFPFVVGFQSTPPCGGDRILTEKGVELYISIHAPLRGRRRVFFRLESSSVFQSTPPCGGDVLSPGCIWRSPRFQSTPPCGGDTAAESASAHLEISIHAPLRGRRIKLGYSLLLMGFQSTPPCGGDPLESTYLMPSPSFQSTPPCGGDLEL